MNKSLQSLNAGVEVLGRNATILEAVVVLEFQNQRQGFFEFFEHGRSITQGVRKHKTDTLTPMEKK